MHVLDTERLTLRWLCASDAAFICQLLNDPDFLRYIGDRGVRTAADARGYIDKIRVDSYERLGFGLFLTALRDSGAAVGICGLIKRDWLDDVDIGFAFLPAYRRRGYAREAAAATLMYGAREHGLARIAAIVNSDNRASQALLEHIGFHFERTVRVDGDSSAEVELLAWKRV